MSLESLLQRADIWRGGDASPARGLPTGFEALDAALGGWPEGGLVEVLHTHAGVGELRLFTPALARLSRGDRWIAFVAPPYIPYAPALARAGVELSRVLVIRPGAARDALWAAEQALRAGTCGAVLAWPRGADFRALRRLQLAAEQGGALGLLFHSSAHGAEPSPAVLRLKLTPGLRPESLTVQILKRRGGWATGPVVVEVDRGPRQGPSHAVAVPASAGARARDLRARC
jgi:hypothetical protein